MRSAIVLMSVVAALSGQSAMMNARMRFEESDAVVQSGKCLHLKTEVVQTSGDWLVIEPTAFNAFEPSSERGRITTKEESLEKCVIQNARVLGYDFTLAEGGMYDVWMRAQFPLAAGYNHTESMDGGEARAVFDSVDGTRVDKYGSLPSGEALNQLFLEPNLWHWFKNLSYELKPGHHHWLWPRPGAWTANPWLDRIVLVRRGSQVRPETATKDNMKVVRAKSGSVTSRRIKTERIRSWLFTCDKAENGGKVTLEYSYGGDAFEPLEPGKVYCVPEKSDYLYVRISFDGSADGALPIVYGYNFRVEKKGSK